MRIERGPVRLFARAVKDRNPLYASEQAARAAGFEAVPCPPTFTFVMAKAFAGDAFFRIGANAIQVFGGIGFTWEHDVHLFYKRLLTLQQAHGTATEHLEELADLVLAPVSSE